jgi:tRNA G37 N-methylase TrmD
VLLSGNHKQIEAWRRAQARQRTLARAGAPRAERQEGD